MNQEINSIRQEYTLASLSEKEVSSDPFLQFEQWFQEAIRADIDDVNAMALSTVDLNQCPHSRMVLLKGLENHHFIFFTNYHSHKGQEILHNPRVSLLFYWKELQRQVRIDGIVSKISEEESLHYFQSRPRESQLGAWASLQSEVLASRADLDNRFQQLSIDYADKDIPKPPHWGGFAVKPNYIEFWQGRASRLHDRLAYTLNKEQWQLQRLNP